MELLTVRLDIPEDANLILGRAHFIKTAEDLYEVVVPAFPSAIKPRPPFRPRSRAPTH